MRWLLSTLLAIIGVLAALAATLLGYAKVELLAPEAFSGRTLTALEDPAVRDYVAGQLTDQLAADGLARPEDGTLVRTAMDAVVESPTFAPIFRRSVEAAHERILSGEEELEIDLTRAADLVERELRKVDARLADAAGPRLQNLAVRAANDDRAAATVEAAKRFEAAAYILPPLAIALLVAGLGLARRRALHVALASLGLAGAGILAGAGVVRGRNEIASRTTPELRPAARATWNALIGDARLWGAALVLAGLLGAAGAAVAARRRRPPSSARSARPGRTSPEGRRGRRGRRAVERS